MEFALKYRKAQDIAIFLKTFLPWLNLANRKGANFARGVLEYLIDGMEVGNRELFIHEVNEHLSSELRGETMTLAEQWKQEGRQEGEQRGLRAGETAILNRQLKLRFREIPADYQKRIEQADAETLLKWGDQILTANSLEEVFV